MPVPFDQALGRTQDLLQNEQIHTLFEAAFTSKGLAARADILSREGDGWWLIEVKASVKDKPDLTDDLAYTHMVASRAGLRITRVSLLLLSGDYRAGYPFEALFAEVDKTSEVQDRAEEFSAVAPGLVRKLSARIAPPAEFILPCRDCPCFPGDCFGKNMKHPVFELPRLQATRFAELADAGIRQIHQITRPAALTGPQQVVWQAVTQRTRIVDHTALQDLRQVRWPAHYLDFETVMTAMPLFADIASYEQVPIQYSLHRYSAPGVELDHREYLADHQLDCRREFAERLLRDLGRAGSIIVYSSFEKTILNGLAARFPDLAARIDACIARLYDLADVLRRSLYDPGFHGSYSIKKTLPVLVPQMGYADLEIQDGASAAACYALMARGQYTAREIAAHRRALLAYCKQDTLAMACLHQALANELAQE